MTLEDLVDEICIHHRNEPTHGIDCACMDKYIREFRKMTECPLDWREQQRVDNVIRTAMNHR